MTGYAVGRFRQVDRCEAIVDYLERIDATLEAFGGRFIVHGGEKTVLEGDWPDDLVVIAFADSARARAWYDSSAYQEILPLRSAHALGDVMIVEGADESHRATDILPRTG